MDLFGHKRQILIDRLIGARPQSSAFDRLCADPKTEIVFDRSDWVSCYLDLKNRAVCDVRDLQATRAITAQGRMIWIVRASQYRRAFHSRADTAAGAFADAQLAWKRRRDMRAHRDALLRIVQDLRWGRVSYAVSVDDAYASPLCEEGVDGFLRSIGMGRYRVFPGWFIAWCFALDRQVGFVIWEAHKRHLRDTPVGPAAQPE